MNDRDESLIRAETAPQAKPLDVSVAGVVDRAIRNGGAGLTASEVLTMAHVLEQTAVLFREYENGTFASHRFVSTLHSLMYK
jgi:hypothetical protein